MSQIFATLLTGMIDSWRHIMGNYPVIAEAISHTKRVGMKADAYTKILDALHKSKKFSNEHLQAMCKTKEVFEERDKALRKLSKGSHEELLRAVDVDAFLLCEEAVDVLKDYERQTDDLHKSETWLEYIDAVNTINHRTLTNLMLIARKDLKQ